MGNILDWIETAQEYEPLIKTGVAAISTYASYKDQKKKNEMQQAAYDDYMKQVAAAGKEAQAAIDINYTPMTVSGVPTTKAGVTDFTAVAAQGGLMSIPNKQRKRYARGPEEWEVETMDEEVLTPYDLQMEEGVNIGEQVFYDTGNPRQDAWGVWNSGGVNQEIYEFDFEIFFDSGDWMDYISQAPAATGDMQMASHEGNDAFLENRYQELLELGLSPAEAAAQAQKELSSGDVPGPMATGGIAGLRHGGRIGYAAGGDMAHRLSELIKKSNAGTITSEEENEMEQLEIMLDYGPGEKDGGRIRKAPGGIMNLGGLEKDYRTTGGFVPIGGRERADDVPARLSKNEFVMTADAVRAAGGGSINKGAQRMYDTMKHLEASPQSKRMTA
jgi:hypothetical protein